MTIKKVLGGVFVGVATGAILGLLMGTDKGKSTRRKITEKGESYIAGFERFMANYMDMINNRMDHMKAETNHLMTVGKEKVEDNLEEVSKIKIK